MQDLKHHINEGGLFDLVVKDGDLDTVDGLETALLVSLFTNARMDESLKSRPLYRSGWVGNIMTAQNGRQLGGSTWNLENERVTTKYLGELKEATSRSFDWMIKDGICRSVSVSTSGRGTESTASINLTARDGKKYDYIYLWNKTNAFTHNTNIPA